MNFNQFLVTLVLLTTGSLVHGEAKFNCANSVCQVTGLYVDKFDEIKVSVPDDQLAGIKEFKVTDSEVPVLTSALCKKMPGLTVISILDSGVQEVMEDAFKDCHDLKEIHLVDNWITSFKNNTFNQNKQLEMIDVSSNSLVFIDDHLFEGLEKLKILSLANNDLEYISPEAFRDMKSLTTLKLNHNFLMSMDAETLKRDAPQLTSIDLFDNDFECEKLKKYKEALSGVSFNHSNLRPRSRPFDSEVDGLQCLTAENYKKALAHRSARLKTAIDDMYERVFQLRRIEETYNVLSN